MYNGQPITKLACGAEFSMIMDCKGNLYSFGCPEYGQLGTVLFWGALLKFCAIVGLGEKKRPASVSPSGQLKHRLTSSKKRGVGAATKKGVARGEGVSAAGLEIMGRREGGTPRFHPGARRQGIIRTGNSSPGRSG